jgi:hypothetical protein
VGNFSVRVAVDGVPTNSRFLVTGEISAHYQAMTW